MDVVHVESESAAAGGFRGMGEGGTIGAPAPRSPTRSPMRCRHSKSTSSILPMTPERIFKLIEKAKLKPRGKSR